MKSLKLALDWIPNPIHSGIFIAYYKGWYEKAGIALEIISPDSHQFQKMPYLMAQAKEVDLAINPSECVILNHENHMENPIVAVAAVLQGFPTAIAKNNASATTNIFQYGAFGIPFEQTIVKELANAALPDGEFSVVNPAKMEIYESLAHGNINITWLFKPIEGVEAEYHGRSYSYFPLEENGIPYGYSPIMMAHPETVAEKENLLKEFIYLTGLGYAFAKENPEETVSILLKYTSTDSFTDPKLLLEMQKATGEYYLDESNQWGPMTSQRWENYVLWLKNHQLVSADKNTEAFFTNRLFNR
ncbi:MAG: ABC transporter substrate-binding protein [Cytophagales bacterium]|nr:ABC transporter substrate-binding protein [Cytophagales bacterium]